MGRVAIILAVLVPIPALLSAQVDLRAEGDSLVGTARAASDLWTMVATTDASGETILRAVPPPTADALARPVTCPEWLQRLPQPQPRR